MNKRNAIKFARTLIVALVDEYDKLEGGDRVFYKAWLGGLSDEVIFGIVNRGDPIPDWSGPMAPAEVAR